MNLEISLLALSLLLPYFIAMDFDFSQQGYVWVGTSIKM